ncbi:MAG TPA: BON domain-containing protein [Thermoanaerobaculaceae bacterium]|nr:BON domain-containing protein [Thermoanaerobaculaceae bacterium]
MSTRTLSSRSSRLLGATVLAGCAALVAQPGLVMAAGGRYEASNTILEQRRADEASTAARVHDALLDRLGPDARDIRIDVHGNRAVLSGTVRRYSTKELSEEVALSVPGVRHTDEEIRVIEPGVHGMARAVWRTEKHVKWALLESRVKTRLVAEIGTEAFHINVEASEGEVSLRGVVPTAAQRELAVRAAASTPGVTRVIDLIRRG